MKTFKNDSREFLDIENAFYLTVPSRLGTLKSPDILKKKKKKTQTDLSRVTSLESSNLPMCLPIRGLVFLPFHKGSQLASEHRSEEDLFTVTGSLISSQAMVFLLF